MKYLLIDNNARFRTFLREFVSNENDDILEFDSCQDISYVFYHFKPDYVLMDMTSGFKAAETLKKAFPEARIIFISDHPDIKSKAKAAQAGADALVSKENLFELDQFIHPEKS